jgi:hypothetical protein
MSNKVKPKLFNYDGTPYEGSPVPEVDLPIKHAYPTIVWLDDKTFSFDPDLSQKHQAPSYRLLKA